MTTRECLTRIYCAVADREMQLIANMDGRIREAKLDTIREIKNYILELIAEPQTNEDTFRNLPRGELIDYLAVRGCPPDYSDVCPEPRNLCVICWDKWLKKGSETNDS